MIRRFDEKPCPPHDYEHALYESAGWPAKVTAAWWVCRKCGLKVRVL